ncbi:MAG TPA: 4-hydroxythreonine-4-phosphate dehydrogenase PdxA [Polyangiaceae bacterium]|nr:4-hydroxythreonine-4-phosphate dehydrogenase PdxA [Polyangiaceae bacterium]
MPRPVIAISIGCPSGIGPEVAVEAAAKARDAAIVLVGDRAVIERAATIVGVAQKRLVDVDARSIAKLAAQKGAPVIGCFAPSVALALARAPFGKPTREAGGAQLAWIDQAMDLVVSGAARALVTGPVSKSAIASSSRAARGFRGHTEHLAARCGAGEVVMAFWAKELTIALVTTHLPILRVAPALTAKSVGAAVFFTADLAARLGQKKPRIVVTGLNPHAGEDGLLGSEEPQRITPGIELGRRRLARARIGAVITGPIGAETAIRHAHAGRYHAVVAMYHDQATIPMKLVGFGEAVNVSLGLPIIRTSVDHGTGYDIAGQGRADARGMKAAIDLAVRLAAQKRAK